MKITNKMLAEAFGKSEQNFKQIQPELKRVYKDAYKFRIIKNLLNVIDDSHILRMLELIKTMKDN